MSRRVSRVLLLAVTTSGVFRGGGDRATPPLV